MAVFTDYSKAFDTIDFFTLIQKMHSLNFSMDFLYWLFNYLTLDNILYKSTQTVHHF